MNNKPNILWFCTDQQRFDTIASLGNAYVNTPTLDRMVRGGVAFTHAYCQNPVCTPSRASFMTGRYPAATRVHRNGNSHFPESEVEYLIGHQLRNAGYRCGLAGKLHLAGCADRPEPRVDDGFEWFRWSHSPRDRWSPKVHDYAHWLLDLGVDPAEMLQLRPVAKAEPMIPSEPHDNVPPEYHHLTWHGERARQFIRESTSPWFLLVNTFEPHPPFNPPWEYYKRQHPDSLPGPHYLETDIATQRTLEAAGVDFQTTAGEPDDEVARARIAAYYATVEMIDHELGRLLNLLEEMGELANTIVLFSSDHGEMLGDHGLVLKGCRFYEGLVRVPLIWFGHRDIVEGVRSDALVELIDIVPTLLDMAGLSVRPEVQGRSLAGILTGSASPEHHRHSVRAEYVESLMLPGLSVASMCRDQRWKVCLYHSSNQGELYDLQNDPWEHRDLWDDPRYADVRDRMIRSCAERDVYAMDSGPERVMRY